MHRCSLMALKESAASRAKLTAEEIAVIKDMHLAWKPDCEIAERLGKDWRVIWKARVRHGIDRHAIREIHADSCAAPTA